MADDSTDTTTEAAPPVCAPCRGTGRIVSRLGGSASTVTCPWCEGTGHVIAGHDAQRRDAEDEPQGEPPPDAVA
jgi:DnaJ-class molecular chaperone